MPAIKFLDDAFDSYERVPLAIAQWADDALDRLAAGRGDADLRRKRWQHSEHFGASRRHDGEEYWLIWSHDEANDRIVVHHLNLAPQDA